MSLDILASQRNSHSKVRIRSAHCNRNYRASTPLIWSFCAWCFSEIASIRTRAAGLCALLLCGRCAGTDSRIIARVEASPSILGTYRCRLTGRLLRIEWWCGRAVAAFARRRWLARFYRLSSAWALNGFASRFRPASTPLDLRIRFSARTPNPKLRAESANTPRTCTRPRNSQWSLGSRCRARHSFFRFLSSSLGLDCYSRSRLMNS